MTITVAFIGQSVGNGMFTVSSAPPVCPANCYMLNRSTYTWGPVTGNGAIAYAKRLNQVTGQEIRLYNACWDGSSMVSTYAPSWAPNLYWTNMGADGPLASFYSQVTSGGYLPQLLELNQGQAEAFSGVFTNANVWVNGAASMYAAILSHFGKTPAQMPITVWTGMRGGVSTSRNMVAAHQTFSANVAGAKLGISYYDSACPDGIHPDATSNQISGARAAVIALSRIGGCGYDDADCGPRIISADRFAHVIILKTTGHPLRVEPWRTLQGFQIWWSDFSGQAAVADARVIDACTVQLKMSPANGNRPWITYHADFGQSGGSAVYDTQDCGFETIGMPMVPCLSIQSAT